MDLWKYGDDRGGVYLVRLWSEDKNNRFKDAHINNRPYR